MIAIPPYTNLSRFHASIMNDYTALLLACYDHATAPTFPFNGNGSKHAHLIWSGFILHCSDTFRYSYNLIAGHGRTGHCYIYVNDVAIYDSDSTGIQSGTVDISALSLTVGQVYSVEVHNDSGYGLEVLWLGETKTPSYTAPPTFADTDVLTAANLQSLYTSISEVRTAVDRGCNSFPWSNAGMPGHHNGVMCRGSNDSKFVGKYSFFHAHDTLRYYYRHGTQSLEVHTKFYINGTFFQQLSESTFDTAHAGTWDLTALGLTKGQIYTLTIRTELDGTSHDEEIFCVVYQLSEESALTVTPPPIWAHGGQNINAANLNRYSTIINAIHPGAASPTAPAYYEVPAVNVPDNHRFRLQHRYRWLRYRGRTGKTVEMTYGGGQTKVKMPQGSGNQSYDLAQVPNLGLGEYYNLDDCSYAQEAESSQ